MRHYKTIINDDVFEVADSPSVEGPLTGLLELIIARRIKTHEIKEILIMEMSKEENKELRDKIKRGNK